MKPPGHNTSFCEWWWHADPVMHAVVHSDEPLDAETAQHVGYWHGVMSVLYELCRDARETDDVDTLIRMTLARHAAYLHRRETVAAIEELCKPPGDDDVA